MLLGAPSLPFAFRGPRVTCYMIEFNKYDNDLSFECLSQNIHADDIVTALINFVKKFKSINIDDMTEDDKDYLCKFHRMLKITFSNGLGNYINRYIEYMYHPNSNTISNDSIDLFKDI